MADESERAVQAAIEAELRLLDPAVRATPALVLQLLDPDFTEIGASGRRWDTTSILTVTTPGSVSRGSGHRRWGQPDAAGHNHDRVRLVGQHGQDHRVRQRRHPYHHDYPRCGRPPCRSRDHRRFRGSCSSGHHEGGELLRVVELLVSAKPTFSKSRT